MWWRSDLEKPEHGRGRVLVKAPSGKALKELSVEEFVIDLEQYPKMRVTGKFVGIPFKGSGVYTFIVQQKTTNRWAEVASIPPEILQKFHSISKYFLNYLERPPTYPGNHPDFGASYYKSRS